MSFHNKPNYQIPELIEALKAHRLPHDTPSQLADSFRIGWMACRELARADSAQEDAARLDWIAVHGSFGVDSATGEVGGNGQKHIAATRKNIDAARKQGATQ